MTVEDVIELIKKRRKQHLRSPVGEDAGDPLRWSEGGFHRAMIQEYDALLDEIQRVETSAESR
jgi:hypothetical protein